jgi:hypothetical protein
MSGMSGIATGKGILMRTAKLSIRLFLAAAAGAALLAGCQKAGDGLGLDADGHALRFCEVNPGDPACAVNPCIANPSGPGCQVDSCLAPAPAPGCSVDVCAADPTHPSCPQKVRFAEVFSIFEANYCLQCHVTGGTGYNMTGLLLTADSAYAQLVNVPSYNQATAAGFMRVKPGNPDSSILYIKISMSAPRLPNGRYFGSFMPMGKKLMEPAQMEVVRKWILDGALQ